jgi:integrase
MYEEGKRIHGKARYDLARAIRKAEDDEIGEDNKKLILKFIKQHFSKGISEPRCVKMLPILRNLSRLSPTYLGVLDKDNLIELLLRIRSMEKHAEATKEDYVLILKQFFKWYEDEDERLFHEDRLTRQKAIQFYKYLRDSRRKNCRRKIDPSDIITELDISELVKRCGNVRDRAFMRLLHESGCRIGEILSMKIKDVKLLSDGRGNIHVDGKTGQRRLPIVYSVPYLRDLLDSHEFKDYPNEYLWRCEIGSHRRKALEYRGAYNIVRDVWEKLPTEHQSKQKPHNPHAFRHSRATLLAPHLSYELLCKFMGWTAGSKEARTYVHLCPEDLDNAYFGKMGLETRQSKPGLEVVTCPFCGTHNSKHDDHCKKCSRAMNSETVIIDSARDSRTLQNNIDKIENLLVQLKGIEPENV